MQEGLYDDIAIALMPGEHREVSMALLATKLGATWIDLDDLYWLPDWQERGNAEFCELLRQRLASVSNGRWVVSGGYTSIVGTLLLEHATATSEQASARRAARDK